MKRTRIRNAVTPMLYSGIQLPGCPDLENIRKLDLLPMPMLEKMQRYGIAIDKEYFRDLTFRLEQEMDNLKQDILCVIPAETLGMFIGRAQEIDDWSPINIDSPQQLAELLFDCLKLDKGRSNLKRTSTGTRISTGKKQLETLKKGNPIIQSILDYRERAKLISTYTRKLPEIAILHPMGECTVCELKHKVETWRVHTQFTTTRTRTGRLASKNPNLQNIPARTKLGREVRRGFVAAPGYVIVGRDLSQIELRLLAHCANERHMLEIYRQGLDIHLETACRAFNLPPEQVDKNLHRAPCKNVNFGICYGLSAPGLYDLMAVTFATAGLGMPDWMTTDWCGEFIEKWFTLYPGVRDFMEQERYRARRYGRVWTLFGRMELIPEAQSCLSKVEQAGMRQAGNLKIQGSAADLLKLIMGKADEDLARFREESGTWNWPLLTVHDELLVEVEEDWGESVNEILKEDMETATIDSRGNNCLRVDIKSEGKIMQRWEKE